jgi:hypothetical protein
MREYREHERNATSNGLGAIQMGLLTQEQLFLSVGLPRGDGSAVQVDSHGLAGWQAGFYGAVFDGYSRLGK